MKEFGSCIRVAKAKVKGLSWEVICERGIVYFLNVTKTANSFNRILKLVHVSLY
jgi:hypothetical protein